MISFDPHREIDQLKQDQAGTTLSLQHVLEWLSSNDCTLATNTKDQYRRGVSKYAKLQRREPKSIEANVSTIQENMPLSSYRSMQCKSVEAFKAMRRCVVAAIKGATGELAEKRALCQQIDEWLELLEAVDDWRFAEPDNAPSKEEIIRVKVLASIARPIGVNPQDLATFPIETILSQPMKITQKEPAKRAFQVIRYLQKNGPQAVRSLLPKVLVPLPPKARKRFVIPEVLHDEISSWVELASRGVWSVTDEDFVEGTTPKSYYRAIVKVISTLSNTDFVDVETIETIATTFDTSAIVHCVKTWKSWKADKHPHAISSKTAYDYLYSIITLVRKNGESADHIVKILKTDTWLKSHKQRDSKMTDKTQTFCRGVVTNNSERLSFVSSSISCQKKAQKHLREMKNGPETNIKESRKLAIRFGVAAAFAALEIDAIPARCSPVLRATFRGPDA